MHYYSHYIGDYQRDTAHLTLLEHGVYRQLLDHYYATEKPLPSDLPSLFRITRAQRKAERQAEAHGRRDRLRIAVEQHVLRPDADRDPAALPRRTGPHHHRAGYA